MICVPSSNFTQNCCVGVACNTHVLSTVAPGWQDPVHSSATVTRSDAVARPTRQLMAMIPALGLAVMAVSGCATPVNQGSGGSNIPLVQSGKLVRSEEHTSELQSQFHLVCRLLLEK